MKTVEHGTSWVGIQLREWKRRWKEHKRKPEAKGMAQKRKEQVDGKRVVTL